MTEHMSIFRIRLVVVQFECGTRILRVIHGRDARATLSNCTTAPDFSRATCKLLRYSYIKGLHD